jgi:tetratricopeptide (TPR) repeat protein
MRSNLVDASGQRQNEWVLWMDGRWQITRDSSEVVYYRIIRYENDKPAGTVTDFYRNGVRQYEGRLIADRPEEIPDGTQTWFYPGGQKRIVETYNKGSSLDDALVLLRSGKRADENWIEHYRRGEKLSDEKRYDEASEEFKIALENAEAFGGRENEDYATIADWLGIVCGLANRKEEAIFYKEEFVSVRKVLRDPPDTLMVSTLSDLGSYYRQTGNLVKAKSRLTEFLGYTSTYFKGTHPGVPDAMQTLGSVLEELHEYDEALIRLAEVRRILEMRKEDTGDLRVRNTLALSGLYFITGDLTKGERLLSGEMKDIKTKYGPSSEIYCTALGLLARIHLGAGQYRLAESEWNDELTAIKASKDDLASEYAAVLASLAELQLISGRPLQADQFIREAKAIYEKQKSRDVFYFEFLAKLMNVHAQMGNKEQVMVTAKALRDVAGVLYGTKSLRYAQSMLRLADASFQQKKWSETAQFVEEGLRIYASYKGVLNEPEKTTFALLESRLASVYVMQIISASSTANLALARDHIDKSIAVFNSFREKIFSVNITDTYLISATIHELDGQQEKADRLYDYIYKNVRQKWGENHPYLIDLLVLIAKKSEIRKDLPASFAYYEKAIEKHAYYINHVLPYVGETEKENFYEVNKQVLMAFHGFASQHHGQVNRLPEAWCNLVLAQKGIILKSSNPLRQAIFASGDETLKRHFSEWQNLKNVYGKMLRDITVEPERVRKMADSVGVLERKISRSATGVVFNPNQVTWKDVQENLGTGEAAVEIVYTIQDRPEGYDTAYYAITIRSGLKTPVITKLVAAPVAEGRQLRFYRNAIMLRQPDTTSYNIYWRGLEPSLQGIHTVYYSPDGVFHQINPSTLFNPTTRKFLADEIHIRVLPSVSWLSDRMGGLQGLKDLIFFAHPDYGGTAGKKMDATRSLDLESIAELPGTELELSDLAVLMNDHNINHQDFEGMEATEDALKLVRHPSVLHIATHGYFLPASIPSEQFQNPLLRSGLLLAGCQKKPHLLNDRHDDGVLTAFEASLLSLHQTELVVLSACETGLGDVKNGEGVYGLQRGFFLAGARRVLMSLWKVDDSATHKFMVAFYRHWINTGTIEKAFQLAQAETRTDYPDPYYWGSFILNGH